MTSKLNYIFIEMKQRCYNPNHKRYNDYGGRGINICDEWLNPESSGIGNATKGWISFKQWALSHGYKSGLSIDRIDNNKGYSPDNCRWVDMKTQSNNKRCCHYITHNGKTQTLKQWCEEKNLKYNTIFMRIVKYKWPIEKALEFN